MKTRSNHRRLSTIAKPDSESHCKPWWEDLWRIRNGCTGSCSRKWYSSLHDFCIATHLTCVRSYVSPTLVWQLRSANRSTFLSLSGHLARICTEPVWFRMESSDPASNSWPIWMAISAATDLTTQLWTSRCSIYHGGLGRILQLVFLRISLEQRWPSDTSGFRLEPFRPNSFPTLRWWNGCSQWWAICTT